MATATTNVTEALRYTYGVNKLLYMFNQESPTWKMLGRVKKPVGGRGQFIMPILKQNPGAYTGITQGGTLPTGLAPATTEATFSLVEFAGMYDLSWKLIQDARSDKFAFKQAIQMMDEGIRRRIFRVINSMLIDDGRGRLGVLPAADDQTTITLNGLPRVEIGMVVDVMDNSDDDTKLADSVTVTGVDPQNRTITVSGAPSGTAAGDYVVIQDTCDDDVNDSLNTYGLLAVIDDDDPTALKGNFGGIDRDTAGNEFWKSVVLSNSGTNRPFTEDLGLTAMDYAREKGSGMLDAWISNLAIGRRYHETLRAETYAALSSVQPIAGGLGRKDKGKPGEDGKSKYEFSGIPWYFDPYFAANTIVGLDTSHFFIGVGENEVPRPISEIFNDIPFFRQTSSATFEVAWYHQMELLSDNPAAGVKIEDVAES